MEHKNKRNSKPYLLIIVGILASLGPFVTDFYLPAFPQLTTFFGTQASMTQLSLTFCMLGLAIGQIFIGPISDRYGRKIPLIISILLFVISTAACVTAWSIKSFIFFRLIQGLSGAGGIVISRSIVVDLYEGKELARFFSMLAIVQAIAPIVSPVLGGLMLYITDWRGIFVALTLLEVIVLFALFPFKESLTREQRKNTKLTANFAYYGALLRHKRFMYFVCIQAFGMGVMFAYIASSPFIFQEIYGLSPLAYSICFGLNALSIMGGNMVITRFSSIEKALYIGTKTFTAIGVLTSLALIMHLPFLIVEITLFSCLFFLGMMLPTSTTLAMALERNNSGNASAVLGFLAFLMGGIVSPLTGIGNMLYSTGIIILICSIATLFCARKVLRSKPAESTNLQTIEGN